MFISHSAIRVAFIKGNEFSLIAQGGHHGFVVQHLLLPLVPLLEYLHIPRNLEVSIVFQNAHPLQEGCHNDITHCYLIAHIVGAFPVGKYFFEVCNNLISTPLMDLLFLVEEHRIKTSFQTCFHKKLTIKVYVYE